MIYLFSTLGYLLGATATYIVMRESSKLIYNKGYKKGYNKAVKDAKEIEDYFK